MTFPKLYLASQSPRRRELLEQIAVDYSLVSVDVDESRREGEPAAAYVQRLALEKAGAGWAALAPRGLVLRPVLGADTAVLIGDEILGKPSDAAAARSMLERLSGRRHEVLTGICLYSERGPQLRLSTTEVWFRRIEDAEITAYWASGEPRDKAGGYAIQGLAGEFVERINGSYSAVVGLPLFETAQLLRGYAQG